MNVDELLSRMRDEKKLGASQAGFLLNLHERSAYSVHREMRFLLYIGILLVLAGVGMTIRKYFVDLGDMAVVSALSLCAAAAFVYCFRKGGGFDCGEVASPSIAFDYVLFFGCAFFAMDIAYVETQFHVLGDGWKNYLLISAALFLFFAYRFDNRLVLSLALSTLAAWFGFTLSAHRYFSFAENYRLYAITYALIAGGLGILSRHLDIKKHFFDIYLNFSIHFICVAFISGIAEHKLFSLYFPALMLVCALLAFYAVNVRGFLYLLYAVIYGYIGISIVTVDLLHRQTFFVFAYFIFTSLAVIGLVFKMSRKFREAS